MSDDNYNDPENTHDWNDEDVFSDAVAECTEEGEREEDLKDLSPEELHKRELNKQRREQREANKEYWEEEKRRDEERLASMSPQEREEELQRRREIHFGTLRIPMHEMITFTQTGAQYMVASGAGRPENGGTLLVVPGKGLCSLGWLTRRLMGKEFDEDGDVWALWEYKGETLRNIFGRYFPRN
jgi:hypothetical protein